MIFKRVDKENEEGKILDRQTENFCCLNEYPHYYTFNGIDLVKIICRKLQ